MSRWRPVGLLLLTALVGCTYQRAMQAAIAHTDAGRWEQAQEAYELALAERPLDDAARQGRTASLEAQVDAAISDAERAFAAGDFEAMVDALSRAERIDRDRPEVLLMAQRARAQLQRQADADLQRGDVIAARALLDRIEALFPPTQATRRARFQSRAHHLQRARELFDARRHEAALAELAPLLEAEPDAAAGLAHAVRMDWADDHVERALIRRRARDPGAVAAHRILAYEIAGRVTDRRAVDEALAALAADAPMRIQLLHEADPLSAALGQAIDAAIAGHPEARSVDDAADLTLRLAPAAPRCDEQAEQSERELSFLAGTVEVETAAHRDAREQAERLAQAARAAEVEANARWAQLQLAQPGTDTHAHATSVYQAAFDAAERARAAEAQALAQLAEIPHTTTEGVREQRTHTVQRWTRTCEAGAQIAVETRWGTATHAPLLGRASAEGERVEGLDPSQASSAADTASDASLTQDAGQRAAADAEAWLAALLDTQFPARVDAVGAALREDPQPATTEAFRLLLGARDRLDDATVEHFRALLADAWGLRHVPVAARR